MEDIRINNQEKNIIYNCIKRSCFATLLKSHFGMVAIQ